MGAELSREYSISPPSFANSIEVHLQWKERGNVNSLTKSYRSRSLTREYYRWLCERLSYEHGVYMPPFLPYQNTWKSLFFELFTLRNLWTKTDDDNADTQSSSSSSLSGERFKISVTARFRPKNKNAVNDNNDINDDDKENDEKEITLPLHQRLAMIKMSHNLKSNKEALKVLAYEGGWFRKKWNCIEEDQKNNNSNNKENNNNDNNNELQVNFSKMQKSIPSICNKENAEKEKFVAKVQTVDPGSGRVVMIAPDVGLREFVFDNVLNDRSSQSSTYETVSRKLIVDFINGFNGTIIAYGQTGSGKSHTMFGLDDTSIFGADLINRGIVPRACQEILEAIEHRKKECNIVGSLSISYVEIYGDTVSDLLKHGARVGHNKASSQRFVLSGQAEKTIESIAEVSAALQLGESQKRRAATAMNDRSTRAHSVFILTLRQECKKTGTSLSSKLFLADLGGSEQVKKSKVESGVSQVQGDFSVGFKKHERMREAVNINLGLLALKKCIEALNTSASYVPFQDSKLTMLLSQGLGGDCKTSVIVCSSMESKHSVETLSSLRFGEKCSLIENEAKNQATMLAGVLTDLRAQIKAVEEAIKVKERWVLKDVVREDTLAEENTIEASVGAKEIMKVSELVGAETERKELEMLLKRMADFTGTQPLDTEGGKKAIGFGRKYAELYGLGSEYNADEDAENKRFESNVDIEELPTVVKAKGGKLWKGDQVTDPKALEKLAKKTNRNKSVYSGISA